MSAGIIIVPDSASWLDVSLKKEEEECTDLCGKMHCFTHIEVALGMQIKNGNCLREKRTWKMERKSEEKVKVSISAKKSCLMVV